MRKVEELVDLDIPTNGLASKTWCDLSSYQIVPSDPPRVSELNDFKTRSDINELRFERASLTKHPGLKGITKSDIGESMN